MTVGESETGGTKCADIYDLGFYNCDEPLNGRYITFHATNPVGNVNNYWSHDTLQYELVLSNFKAFPSANLITTATLVEEPILVNSSFDSYSGYMQTLNPRSFITNSDVSPINCAKYKQNTGNFVFKMAEKTYVDYVIATGESKDGANNVISIAFDSSEDCSTISNLLFSEGGQIYVSNTTSTTDAVYCGRVGSAAFINFPMNVLEFEDVTKMGGTI